MRYQYWPFSDINIGRFPVSTLAIYTYTFWLNKAIKKAAVKAEGTEKVKHFFSLLLTEANNQELAKSLSEDLASFSF